MQTNPCEPGSATAEDPAPERLAEHYRDEFPILADTAYLNSNSLGALSRRSLAARREFEADWHELGGRAWYLRWLDRLAEVRHRVARSMGADADEVALVPSVSAGLTSVLNAVDFGERPKAVVSELDFPTLTYQLLSRRRTGVEVEMLQSPDGVEVPLEAWEEAVDGRTALVATSHVLFSTGAIQDAEAIGRIAREAGALFLLDAYQSHGQIPVDVGRLGADVLLSGALKWTMGGPGLAYLYVRRELARRLEPTSLSWFGVEDQFSFDPRAAEPREDARRFEMGTPAVGAAFTALGGLEILEEIGVDAIRRRNRALAEVLVRRLPAIGYELRIASEPARRSAVVLARHPRADDAADHLAEHDVIVDARPGVVRLSPHFYNHEGDLDRALAALEEVAP